MKASNAGAILLIGFGVLMLNLAYTGRASAVWDALRGSEPASTETPEDNPPAEQWPDDNLDGADSEPGGGGGRGFDKKPSKPAAGHGVGWRTVRIN